MANNCQTRAAVRTDLSAHPREEGGTSKPHIRAAVAVAEAFRFRVRALVESTYRQWVLCK